MLKNLALLFTSSLICLLLLELCFRIFPPDDVQVNNPYAYVTPFANPALDAAGRERWVRHDYSLKLDVRGYYKKSGGTIYYFKDQFGGRWISSEKRKVGNRIMIALGDSVTYGFGLRYEDTFIHRLSSLLPRNIDFVNLAEPAADAMRSLEIYMNESERVPHQAVIYGLHLNDLIEFTTSYVATNRLLGSPLVKHSKFAAFLVKRWDRSVGRWRRVRELTDPANFEKAFFKNNFDAILRMDVIARKRKVAFHVVLLPILVDLREGTFDPVYREIRARLEAHGINPIDLTKGLRDFEDSDLWILPVDQHPNEIANRIFAEKLRDHLVQLLR